MYALSPEDPIEPVEASPVQISAPKFQPGQAVNRDCITPWHRKRILREILRDTRAIVDKLRRGGFIQGKIGTRLPEYNKEKVRKAMSMMDSADSIEICGAAPWGGHACGSVAHESYLVSGQCHSGLMWQYFLLFRKEIEGQNLIFIHKHPVVLESNTII